MQEIRDTQVAVCGGAGFLGSHLTDFLIEQRNCCVVVFDDLSVGLEKYIHPKAFFEQVDLTDSDVHVANIFRRYDVRWVFMAAAIPFVPDGFRDPLHTFDVTATAVLRVLEAAREADVDGTLVVGSAEIFGNTISGAVSEETPAHPRSTYAAAKQAADSLVQVRWHEAGVRALVVRQFNSYGPRALHALILMTLIDQFSKGPKVRLGNNTVRDFQYCDDAIRAWVAVLETRRWGEVVNCGSESSIRIFDLARMVGKVMGHAEIEIEVDPSRVRPEKVEVWHLHADCTKLNEMIGRRDLMSLEDGIRRTVEWYRVNGGWDFAEVDSGSRASA